MPKKQVIGCAICRGSLPVESALHGLEERLVLPARGAGQAFRRRTRVRQHEQRRRAGILHDGITECRAPRHLSPWPSKPAWITVAEDTMLDPRVPPVHSMIE